MLVDDLTVEVRNSSLARVGQILASDLVGSEFVPRFNNVGAWKVLLRASHPLADALRAPGAGIIVTLPSGQVLLSGPTRSAKITKTATDPSGVWEILGVDDSVILGNRLAYPTPTTADVTLQTSEYDVRTGKAETVMKGYVTANIGSSAPSARKIASLTVEADSARGATITGKARFDKLGQLLTTLASTSGLGFDLTQSGANIVFSVFQPTDRSATIRMDVDNQRLTKTEYSYTNPTATRVIVAGQGTGTSRTFVEVSNTASLTAESDWASRIEVFKDSRNTNDATQLNQAGADVLADGGFTIKAVSVTPSDDQTMRYGTDWGLGDKVTVVIGTDEVAQIVTEVAVIVTEEGIKVGATVGDPIVAAVTDTETSLAASSSDQDARISNLERNDTASSSGGASDWASITGKPSSFTPSAHASTHASGGTDAVTLAQSQVTGLTTALAGKASTTHASTHASGGSDAITIAPAQVTGTAVITTDTRLSDSRTPTGTAGGDLTGTYPNPTLAATAVTAGAYGSASAVGTFTVDAKGRITLAGTTSIAIAPSQVTGTAVITTDSRLSDSRTPTGSAGGDLTGTYPNPTLGAVGTAGTYTKVTTDAKGRVTTGTTLLASDVPNLDASKITSGTLPIANGGTGGTTADTARSSLSAVGVFSQATAPAGGNIGDVWIDTSSNVNSWSSFMPYAVAAGSASASATSGSTTAPLFWDAGVTVTFPSGRFTVAPTVTVSSFLATAVVWASLDSVSSTGFTVRAVRVGSYPGSATTHHWTAVQMTPTTAGG